MASLSTSCVKNCNCKYYDDNGKLKYEETQTIVKGFGEKCKDYDREATDYQEKAECN